MDIKAKHMLPSSGMFVAPQKVDDLPWPTHQLARKGELGFQGFVQSDWWAVHEPSFVQGLDQEMPGQATELFLSPSNTSQHPQRVDEAATRILAAMYKVNLHETGMFAGHVFWPSSHFTTIHVNVCIYIYIHLQSFTSSISWFVDVCYMLYIYIYITIFIFVDIAYRYSTVWIPLRVRLLEVC